MYVLKLTRENGLYATRGRIRGDTGPYTGTFQHVRKYGLEHSRGFLAVIDIVAQCVGDIKAYQRLYAPYGSPLIDHRAICIWQRHVTLPYAYGTVVN